MNKYLILLVLLISFFMGSCSNHKMVAPEEFLEVSQKLDVQESAHNVSFLGIKDGQAYLEIWNGIVMMEADQYFCFVHGLNLIY